MAMPPDAVMLLRDVGQRQELAEGARQQQRMLHRQRREQRLQRGKVRIIAGPRTLGEGPDTFHRLVERLTGLRFQRLPKQRTQQPHIIPQRGMRIISHGNSVDGNPRGSMWVTAMVTLVSRLSPP